MSEQASEQVSAAEQTSGASEQARRKASGSLLTYHFQEVLNHSGSLSVVIVEGKVQEILRFECTLRFHALSKHCAKDFSTKILHLEFC